MRLLALLLFFITAQSVAQTLHFTTLDWPPFYGEKLPEQGKLVEITRKAFQNAGYDIDIRFLPWKRALEDARRGKYDGVIGLYKNKNREKDFLFSQPLYTTPEVFVGMKDIPFTYTGIPSLKGKIVGGTRGVAPLVELEDKGVQVETTTNDSKSIQKLLAGRIDLVLINQEHFKYLAKCHPSIAGRSHQLSIFKPDFKKYQLFIAIGGWHPESQKLIQLFNAELNRLKLNHYFFSPVIECID